MSYQSRVYRQRNPKSGDEKKKDAFFKQADSGKSKKNSFFQAKLAVNEPGDAHEKQADSVADSVVAKSTGKPMVQNKEKPEVQRLATTKEEEQVSSNDQRMERDKEKPFQRKAEEGKEKEKMVHKKEEGHKDKEDKVHKKDEAHKDKEDKVHKKDEPGKEKEKLQKKQQHQKDDSEKIQKKAEAPIKEDEKKKPGSIQRKPESASSAHNLPGVHSVSGVASQQHSGKEAQQFISGQQYRLQRAPGPPLPQFDFPVSVGFFPNFDVQYTPDSIQPQEGTARFIHNIFVQFDKSIDAKQQEKFRTDFSTNISALWQDKFLFELNDPSFTHYLAHVKIDIVFVDDPKSANTIMEVKSHPKDFRSNVADRKNKNFPAMTHVAHLDITDASLEEQAKKNKGKGSVMASLVQQVGTFDFDSFAINAECETGISNIEQHLDNFPDGKDSDEMAFTAHIDYIGRASPEGNKWYNRLLSKKRAAAVKSRIDKDKPKAAKIDATITAEGADKTENEAEKEKYRRVNVVMFPFTPFSKLDDKDHNVAAHEFGHMIGIGDEYDEKGSKGFSKKIAGDRPTHYEDVKAIMGQSVADELTISRSDSIMSGGSNIRKGHYAYFLKALRDLTGKSQWNIK